MPCGPQSAGLWGGLPYTFDKINPGANVAGTKVGSPYTNYFKLKSVESDSLMFTFDFNKWISKRNMKSVSRPKICETLRPISQIKKNSSSLITFLVKCRTASRETSKIEWEYRWLLETSLLAECTISIDFHFSLHVAITPITIKGSLEYLHLVLFLLI